MVLNKQEAIQSINTLASEKKPFLFVSDFLGKINHVLPQSEINSDEIMYYINGNTNIEVDRTVRREIKLKKFPMNYESYEKGYSRVHKELSIGNSYLLNFTCSTNISLNCSLKDIYFQSSAKYKLWFQDQFAVFSPEIFVRIADNRISSYPMKGTINADLPNAEETILNSEKEMAEHATIVDLIRNDMSMHASNVRVEKFRYIDEIRTNDKHLLQVSSKIVGDLDQNYLSKLGQIIFSLLPAGSICGAPKNKTLEIINNTENHERGFYTGIVGFFDGENFDSGVMIRFIQKEGDKLTYKSGGGIHFLSDVKEEYQEMIDKVYVPVY